MKPIINLCTLAILLLTFTKAAEVDLSSLADSYGKEKEFADSLKSIVYAPLKNNKAWEVKFLGIEPLEKSALHKEIQTAIQNDNRGAKEAMGIINSYDAVTQKPFVLSFQISYKADYLDSVHKLFSSVGTPCTPQSQSTIRAFDSNQTDVWCLALPEPYDRIFEQNKEHLNMGIAIGFFTHIDSDKYSAFRPRFLGDALSQWNVLKSGNGRADTLLSEGESLDKYFNNFYGDRLPKFFKGIQTYHTIVYLTQEEVKALKEIRIKALSFTTDEYGEGDGYEYNDFMIGKFHSHLLNND